MVGILFVETSVHSCLCLRGVDLDLVERIDVVGGEDVQAHSGRSGKWLVGKIVEQVVKW